MIHTDGIPTIANREADAVLAAPVTLYSRPGWNSEGAATLALLDRETNREVGSAYSLRYLADTNEVVLLKDDEVVYSELLT